MTEGIDHLLSVFGTILQSRETLQAEGLHLALIEYNKQFTVTYYRYDAVSRAILSMSSEPFNESEFRNLHLFCAFPSPLKNEFKVHYKGRWFYARPLSLWLAPVAFLLLPVDKEEEAEACFREHDTLLQATLSDFLWRAVDNVFTPMIIASLSEDTFQAVFSSAISNAIMPRQWTYREQLHDFSSHLFSPNAQLELLHITLSNGFPIQFDVPAATKTSAQGTQLEWAYLPQRLEQQRTLLRGKIQELYKRLAQRQTAINKLVKMSEFPDKVRQVKEQITSLSSDLGEIEKQLERSVGHVNRLLQATPFSVQSVNQFYPIPSGKFKVVFENTDIHDMGKQVCRILYTLLSYPDRSFDMYLLYANTKNQFTTTSTSSKAPDEKEGAQRILHYLNKDLIRPKELKKAKESGDLAYYHQRLKKGILLLEKCIKLYPELELANVLQDYQFYYEEYWDEGLLEDSFSAPVFQDSMLVSKRTARERITKQLSALYKSLTKNKFDGFRKYLQETIVQEEENGVHYYIFRPEAASSAKWRALEWDLWPPAE